MKKILYILMPFLLILTSCTSNDDSTPGSVNQDGVFVKKIITTYSNGSHYENYFTYNGNKLISEDIIYSASFTGKLLYTYTGNLITKIVHYQGGSLAVTIDFTYENGELVTRVETNSQEIRTYSFTHNDDGTMSFVCSYKKDTGTHTSSGKLYFTNGNITKVEDSLGTRNYVYDSNNTPFNNVLGWNKIIDKDYPQWNSINNVAKFIGEGNYVKGPLVNTYEYDSGGYPLQNEFFEADGTLSYTREYFY